MPKPIGNSKRPDTLIRSLIRTEPVTDPGKRMSGREREALRRRAAASDLSVVPPRVIKRNLTECLKIALDGDPSEILDDRIPLHRLAFKMVRELSDEQHELWRQHRLLELVWDRTEGRVPDKLEIDATVRGVIALPVVSSSALDWSADAVKVLSGHRRDVIDVPALPPASPKDDD